MLSFLHTGQQVNIEPTESEGCTVFEILEIGAPLVDDATDALRPTRYRRSSVVPRRLDRADLRPLSSPTSRSRRHRYTKGDHEPRLGRSQASFLHQSVELRAAPIPRLFPFLHGATGISQANRTLGSRSRIFRYFSNSVAETKYPTPVLVTMIGPDWAVKTIVRSGLQTLRMKPYGFKP
jgi:hypothetical protein